MSQTVPARSDRDLVTLLRTPRPSLGGLVLASTRVLLRRMLRRRESSIALKELALLKHRQHQHDRSFYDFNQNPVDPGDIRKHRTAWISDIHLGTTGCKADLLIDFLEHNRFETLYLVGDILDGWRLRRAWYWPHQHDQIVRMILQFAADGTRVVYVPGNHDEGFRQYDRLQLAGIEVHNEITHRGADGREYLILHGDQFDTIVRYARWLALLGDYSYRMALRVNNVVADVRKELGLPYWSLSKALKNRVKNAVEYISSFEYAIAKVAAERGVDVVVCGHIHQAEMRTIDGILYCNDGDWVESCTALVEDQSGQLEIIRWIDHHHSQQTDPQFPRSTQSESYERAA